MKALLFILLAFALSACGPNHTRDKITGTQSERVTRATAILSKYCKLPGPLLDAHMAEDVILAPLTNFHLARDYFADGRCTDVPHEC